MIFFSERMLTGAILAAVTATAVAQSATQNEPQPATKGQVIFSRSVDENGETKTLVGPTITEPAIQQAKASTVVDAERQAVTFTRYDLEVHLQSVAQQLAVRAQLTVRNDGKTPLRHIPLQISSTLNWERIRLDNRDVSFTVTTLNTDSDHTGQLHEAAVSLAQPLAPGATLQLDVSYSGKIAQTAQRLLSIGTPEDVARHSDWDEIGVDFTGLRGFGNVVWFPSASVPVMLGDGSKLFDQIGENKLRLAGCRFRLSLTDEFPHGKAPTVALINGHAVPLKVVESGSLDQAQEVLSVATASLDDSTLGFESPSLFLAIRATHPAAHATLWSREENSVAAEVWAESIEKVLPFLQNRLGEKPREDLTLLDLPDSEDAPFESGALLATSLHEAQSEQLNSILAHAMTHAWTHGRGQAPPAWLDEGVAHFMGSLWVEKQRGRDQALGSLEAGRTALALAEPSSPGESAGTPLAQAFLPAYFRTKAAYVLWMLRDLVGDDALTAALRSYESHPERQSFEKVLEQTANRPELSGFFNDWVNADKGLPDLTIDGVYPEPAQSGNWLVAVNLSNNGYASAGVNVTVRSGSNSSVQRMEVPARGKAVQRILVQGKPYEVQVNDGTVPETQSSVHIMKIESSALPPPPVDPTKK